MIHPNTVVKTVSPEIGIGVFATEDIPKGTIIVVRDKFDTCMTEEKFCHMEEPMRSFMETYMYHDRCGNLVLSWDHARYMNHSCHSNTMMTDYGLEITIRDISAGDEVTTEYGLLNIQEPYKLCCHCENCRGELRLDDIDVYGDEWDSLIKESLKAVYSVDQPLWPMLEEKSRLSLESYLKGEAEYLSVKNMKWCRI